MKLASGSSGSEALPGSALGTPAYMSPEQAAGRLDELGPASDVYSLGATIYHLLTGEAPFAGNDTAEILKRVQAGDFAPPRHIHPAVPAPLEAVCLKAMSLRPDDRYVSTHELAEDIEHWLADEPVKAWPEPWTVTARRWMSRHRVLVSSAAACLVVALIGSIAATLLLSEANQTIRNREADTQQANQNLIKANEETTTANKNLAKANEETTTANKNLVKANEETEDLLATSTMMLARSRPSVNTRCGSYSTVFATL